MMQTGVQFVLAITALCSCLPGLAHHSRAAFNLDQTIAVEGQVTEVSWTNPHYYFSLQSEHDSTSAEGGVVTWTFEGHSVPGLVRNGWSRRTLTIGERVRVVANPNKQTGVAFALLDHVTRADGQTFYSFRKPPKAKDASVRLPLQPSTDFTGTWRLIRSLRSNLVGGFEPPADWPLTPLAQQQVAEFDINDDPSLQCQPRGLPRMLQWPYAQDWQHDELGYVINVEHSTEQRRIYKQPGVPDRYSDSGYSTGGIQADGSLVITTRHFPAKHWGNARGIDSGKDKKLEERYELVEGGYKMRLTYELYDPLYLQQPVQMSAEYAKVHDFEFASEPECDVATATRHLQFEP